MLRVMMTVRLAAALMGVLLSFSPSFSSEMVPPQNVPAPLIETIVFISFARIPSESRYVHETQAPSEKPKCGRGRYLSDGHCCPRGSVWNGKRCLRNPGLQPECPGGTTGTFPNCQEASAPACAPGTTGRFPNCLPIRTCPGGTTGRYPNCRPYLAQQRCPAGTRGNYPSCQPIVRLCPPGYLGTPPLCRRSFQVQRPPLTQPRLNTRPPLAGPRPPSAGSRMPTVR